MNWYLDNSPTTNVVIQVVDWLTCSLDDWLTSQLTELFDGKLR